MGSWEGWALLGAVVLGAYLVVMWLAALAWTYRDIAARTRDSVLQTVAVLVVAIFNLPGLIIYLIVRPKETLAERYDRQLEAEALLHEIQDKPSCPSCRRKVEDDFIICPYCRSALKVSCESCGRALAGGWVLCPFCGAERPAPPAPVRSATAGEPARVRRPGMPAYTSPAAKPSSAADTPADAAP